MPIKDVNGAWSHQIECAIANPSMQEMLGRRHAVLHFTTKTMRRSLSWLKESLTALGENADVDDDVAVTTHHSRSKHLSCHVSRGEGLRQHIVYTSIAIRTVRKWRTRRYIRWPNGRLRLKFPFAFFQGWLFLDYFRSFLWNKAGELLVSMEPNLRLSIRQVSLIPRLCSCCYLGGGGPWSNPSEQPPVRNNERGLVTHISGEPKKSPQHLQRKQSRAVRCLAAGWLLCVQNYS